MAEDRQTFRQRLWPLHFALAWVLTRDVAFSERAEASDFLPILDKDAYESQDEVDRAWKILHQALADGSVPAFKISEPFSDDPAGEVNEERIAPEALASLDWADLTRDDSDYGTVVVSSSAMVIAFPPGDPMAFTSIDIGPPLHPNRSGYMTLSGAAYWIATEGGSKRIVVRDVLVWRRAFAELLPRIQSGEVRVVGRRRGASLHEDILQLRHWAFEVLQRGGRRTHPTAQMRTPHSRKLG